MSRLLSILFLTITISHSIHCMDETAFSLVVATQQKRIEIIKKILASPECNPNEANILNNTALHCAAFAKDTKIITLLLEHPGTDASLINNMGKTASDLIYVETAKDITLCKKLSARAELNNIIRFYGTKLILIAPNIARQLKESENNNARDKLEYYMLKACNTFRKNGKSESAPVTFEFVRKMLHYYIRQQKESIDIRIIFQTLFTDKS